MLKKIISCFLLVSSAVAESAFPILEENFKSLKEIRLQNKILLPAIEDKISTIHNILEGKTAVISPMVYAGAEERIKALGGLFQNEILASHHSLPLKSVDHSLPKARYIQDHLAALKVMQEGVRGMVTNPFLGINYEDLLAYLLKTHLAQNVYTQKLLNAQALQILFPQGYFKHLATYAYSIKDYKYQLPLKLAIAFAFKGDALTASEEFNILPSERHYFKAFHDDRGPHLEELYETELGPCFHPEGPIYYGNSTLYSIRNKYIKRREKSTRYNFISPALVNLEVQRLFPSYNVGGYHFYSYSPDLYAETSHGPLKAAEVLARLYTTYYLEDIFSLLWQHQDYKKFYVTGLALFKERLPLPKSCIMFQPLIARNRTTYKKIYKTLKKLPTALKTPQSNKLKKVLEKAQQILPAPMLDDIIEQFILSEQLPPYFIEEEDQLDLSEHALNQINLVQRHNYEVFQETVVHKAIEEDFRTKDAILFTRDIANNILLFAELLNIAKYRDSHFIKVLCKKLMKPDLERTNEETTFIKFLEDLPGEFELNFYNYLLTVYHLDLAMPLLERMIEEEGGQADGDAGSIPTKLNYLISLIEEDSIYYPLSFHEKADFHIDSLYPIWGHGTQRIEFSTVPLHQLVKGYNSDPFFLAWKMFLQVQAYKDFFKEEQNIKKFTYSYDNVDVLNQELIRSPQFGKMPTLINALLAKMYVQATWGE